MQNFLCVEDVKISSKTVTVFLMRQSLNPVGVCWLQWSRFEPDTSLTQNLPKRLEQDDSPACRSVWESRMTVITGVNSSTEQRGPEWEHQLFKYELCWLSSLSRKKTINTCILLRKWQVYLWKLKSQVSWPKLSLSSGRKRKQKNPQTRYCPWIEYFVDSRLY